jgi:DNA-binding transcriptional ArsR family regulator
MRDSARWPGQIEEAYFTLEQVRALSSTIRSEVFWTFSYQEPYSTSDVAKMLMRSAPTVRYHVNELLKADLIYPVETRKRRSRTEEAFVHRIVRPYTPRPPYDEAYRHEVDRGLSAILRSAERERRAFLDLAQVDDSTHDLHLFRQAYIRLKPEKVAQLRKRLIDVLYEFIPDNDPEGIRMHVMGYLAPVFGESERLFEEKTGRKLKSDAEPTPEG